MDIVKFPNGGRDEKVIKFPPDAGSSSSVVASGKYRADVYALSAGTFDWVVDSSGEPIYVLADLE